ncbi:hypothetical protein V1520DRAFT_358836 [Lipomyces starkeyi]
MPHSIRGSSLTSTRRAGIAKLQISILVECFIRWNQDDPFEGNEPIEEPENDHGELGINETGPLATSRDVSTISSIGDLGLVIEAMWQVAICTHCKFVVDKALFIDHLKLKHGLDNPNEDAILHVVRQYLECLWRLLPLALATTSSTSAER